VAAPSGGPASGDRLLLVAAAPLAQPGSGGVLAGYILNGRTEILEQAQRLIPSQRKGRLMVSVFMGDRPIASIKGDKAIHSQADAKISETVLHKGEPFVGIGKVLGENFYTGYVPLKDLSGRIVGMLGVGISEDAVAQVRKRTTALFSSLIAGGMIFGFILTFLFSVWLVSPISRLAEGMSRVAEGDLDFKVRIESADELGRLARAFNQVVRAVRERDHKLSEVTESRLTQVEKQVSIGRLAAGVAHEINNPLTAILSLSSLWLKKMPAEDPRREDLQIIVTETSRCREIVQSLLDFARERPIEKSIVDINAIVRETVVLANKYDSMTNVKIELKTAAFPLRVNADAKLLQQVFINLLLNAAEAIEQEGAVRVETDEDSSGGFVQVKVVDNGKGIPREHINRVFEPFFTTKGTGKGTGLGLSVSLGIVQKHEGTIEIESEEGRGTTVTVVMPRVGEAHP
jgi:two-component system NtrC family sensor kinase